MHTAEAKSAEEQVDSDNEHSYDESKTVFECSTLRNASIVKSTSTRASNDPKRKSYLASVAPTYEEIHEWGTVVVIGLLAWGLAYVCVGGRWAVGGDLFRLGATAALGHVAGQLLQRLTALPALLGALLAGALLANVGYVDVRRCRDIDSFLRKIYPVVILGKSALALDWRYLRANLCRLVALGALPWAAEVITLALCLHYVLQYPWRWGFLAGSVVSSLSPAVVLPTLQQQSARGMRLGGAGWAGGSAGASGAADLPRVVSAAGCVDTTLSVGVYGLLLSAIFSEDSQLYTSARACLTMFAGVALGVAWGYVASVVPSARDTFVAESRVLVVLAGGLLANFGTLAVGWGGTGGVAVLLCNMTAAHLWRREPGWQLNANPASRAYRVLWALCEPVLFSYTGAHLLLSEMSGRTMLALGAVLAGALAVRLLVVLLVGWRCGLVLRETLFLCCIWMPKAIVEAVLAPSALDAAAAAGEGAGDEVRGLARTNVQLIALAILLTTPLASLLARYAGPVLLRTRSSRDSNEEAGEPEEAAPAAFRCAGLGDAGDKATATSAAAAAAS